MLLDQTGAQAAHRRVASDAGADDAAADDQHVEGLRLQRFDAAVENWLLISCGTHIYSCQ